MMDYANFWEFVKLNHDGSQVHLFYDHQKWVYFESIHTTIRHQQQAYHEVIPKEELSFLQQSSGCGYTFISTAYVQFCPSVMQRTVLLTSSQLHQEPSFPVDNCFMWADFYCTIFSLFNNDKMWLGDTFYLICFITHHPNANEFEEQVCWERLSLVPQDGQKYSDGMLLLPPTYIWHFKFSTVKFLQGRPIHCRQQIGFTRICDICP